MYTNINISSLVHVLKHLYEYTVPTPKRNLPQFARVVSPWPNAARAPTFIIRPTTGPVPQEVSVNIISGMSIYDGPHSGYNAAVSSEQHACRQVQGSCRNRSRSDRLREKRIPHEKDEGRRCQTTEFESRQKAICRSCRILGTMTGEMYPGCFFQLLQDPLSRCSFLYKNSISRYGCDGVVKQRLLSLSAASWYCRSFCA